MGSMCARRARLNSENHILSLYTTKSLMFLLTVSLIYSLFIGTVTGVGATFVWSRAREFEHYTYDARSLDSGHEFKGLVEGNILRVFKGGERLLWRTPKGEAKLVLAKQPIPYRLHCDVLEEMTIEQGILNLNWVAQDLDELDPFFTVYCFRVSISHFGLEVHDTFHLNHRTVHAVH